MHTPSPKSLAPAPLRYPPPFFVFRFSLRTCHDTSSIHTLHEYGIPSNKPPRSCRNGWYRPPPIGIYDWATTFSPVSSCSTTSESSSLSLELHTTAYVVCYPRLEASGRRNFILAAQPRKSMRERWHMMALATLAAIDPKSPQSQSLA